MSVIQLHELGLDMAKPRKLWQSLPDLEIHHNWPWPYAPSASYTATSTAYTWGYKTFNFFGATFDLYVSNAIPVRELVMHGGTRTFSMTEYVDGGSRATYTRSEDLLVPENALAQTAKFYHGFTAANLAGDDSITGGGRLLGYGGNDTLQGHDLWNDTLDGGAGNDALGGLSGRDLLLGAAGADTLQGGEGNDSLYGGAGDDILNGDSADDLLKGDAGADTLQGGDGSDSIHGGAGEDVLNGDAGDDLLQGDAGADTLHGGEGSDSLQGGAGNDTYVIDSADDVITDASGTADEVQSSVDAFTLPRGVERLTLVGEAVHGTANAANNLLTGNRQDNVLNGGGGRDTLSGGAGDDSFVFGRLKGQFSKIADFDAEGDDVIVLSSAFASLFENGVLRSASLSTDGMAHGLEAQLVYKASTGSLYYDANGARPGGATEIASLANKPAAESIGTDDFALLS